MLTEEGSALVSVVAMIDEQGRRHCKTESLRDNMIPIGGNAARQYDSLG